MSEPRTGYGTKLYVKIGSDYELVGGVRNLTPASISRDSLDTTSQDSPAGFKESRPGNTDPGNASFELLFDPADLGDLNTAHGYLFSRLYTQLIDSFRVVFTETAKKFEFDGYLENFALNTPHDNLITANCSVKISGEIVADDAT